MAQVGMHGVNNFHDGKLCTSPHVKTKEWKRRGKGTRVVRRGEKDDQLSPSQDFMFLFRVKNKVEKNRKLKQGEHFRGEKG
jgi:hypothetical protein